MAQFIDVFLIAWSNSFLKKVEKHHRLKPLFKIVPMWENGQYGFLFEDI